MMRGRRMLGIALVATALALTGCSGTGNAPAQEEATILGEQDADFDANAVFAGQWRGSVVGAGGKTPYGTSNGPEPMLDIFLNEDGTFSVEPLEAHKDLPSEEGTWTVEDSSAVTLALSSGDVTLTAINDATLEANASDFGIEGFDKMTLVLY